MCDWYVSKTQGQMTNIFISRILRQTNHFWCNSSSDIYRQTNRWLLQIAVSNLSLANSLLKSFGTIQCQTIHHQMTLMWQLLYRYIYILYVSQINIYYSIHSIHCEGWFIWRFWVTEIWVTTSLSDRFE